MSTASHYGASGSIQHEQNSYGLNQQSYGHKDHLNDSQQQHSEIHHQSVLPEENATQINADAVQPVSSQGLSGSIQSSKPTPVVADSQPSHQDSHSYDTASTAHQQSLDHQPADSADLSPTTVTPEHTNEPLISTISLASEQNQNQYGLNQQNLYGLTKPAYGQ
nr:unnamed protein product [Callosobruchus chinensis]